MRLSLIVVVILLAIIACRTTKNSAMHLPAFDLEGHRGCRGLMPENTIPAMLKAIDLKVTTLELDAVITADRKVLVSHEPFFNHEISTDPDGQAVTVAAEHSLNIFRMPFAETQRYDVGLRPHPRFPQQEKIKAVKPALEELIDDVEAYLRLSGKPKLWYNIETKCLPATDGVFHPAPDEFVELLTAIIQKKKIAGRTIIQSFDFRTLKLVHEKHPGIRTAALIEEGDHRTFEEQLAVLGFIPDIYSPHFALVTPELVQACHAKHIKLVPWTVNDVATMQKLKDMGVDGLISDYPDRYSQLK